MLYLVLWVCLSSGMTIDWLQSAHLPFQGVGLSSFTFVQCIFPSETTTSLPCSKVLFPGRDEEALGIWHWWSVPEHGREEPSLPFLWEQSPRACLSPPGLGLLCPQHCTVSTGGVAGPWDTIHGTLSCWPKAKFGHYGCSSGNGKIAVFLCFG